MNKQDISSIKKGLKIDPSKVTIGKIFSVYLRKETEEILQTTHSYFDTVEAEQQELYVKNFKASLSGGINSKLFELRFNNEAEEPLSTTLQDMVQSDTPENFLADSELLISKILNNFSYDKDVVLNVIQCTYETETEMIPFILGTVNKVEAAKKELMFDYLDREFDVYSNLNLIVNLKSPLDGFMYPVIEEDQANVNKILNFHSKKDKSNLNFIVNILTCNPILTAKEEKIRFNQILKLIVSTKIKPAFLHHLYGQLSDIFSLEENIEDRVITKRILQRIIEEYGIELQQDITDSYEEILGIQDYGFTFDNVVPDFSKKSISIENPETSIKVSPTDLSKVQQIVDENGERFILIRITDDSSSEGFDFETERQVPISLIED